MCQGDALVLLLHWCCTGAALQDRSILPWLGRGTEGPEVTQLGLCSDTRALSPVPAGCAPCSVWQEGTRRGFNKSVSPITRGFEPCWL